MRSTSRSAFALIELMVIVALLSVVAAIVVPKYLKLQVQKKQEECLLNLKSLWEAEKAYFEKNNVYTTDLQALAWTPSGKVTYQYQFETTVPPEQGFLFRCTGTIDQDSTLDEATINESGQITQVVNDLHQ